MNNIESLLNKKKQFITEDEVTRSLSKFYFPGIRIHDIVVKDIKDWKEYSVLVEADKVKEDAKYLNYVFRKLSEFLSLVDNNISLDVMGIQEVRTDLDKYYILFYILK